MISESLVLCLRWISVVITAVTPLKIDANSSAARKNSIKPSDDGLAKIVIINVTKETIETTDEYNGILLFFSKKFIQLL